MFLTGTYDFLVWSPPSLIITNTVYVSLILECCSTEGLSFPQVLQQGPDDGSRMILCDTLPIRAYNEEGTNWEKDVLLESGLNLYEAR